MNAPLPLQSRRAHAVPDTAVLRIDRLSVSFDGFKAINDLSFAVEPGELRVVIGPNGAGKTTLLDLICGKTAAQSGSILFGGAELTTLSEHEIVRAGVGRKFQTPSVYEDLSVLENFEISYPRHWGVMESLRFRRSAGVMAQIEAVADQVFLLGQLGRPAGQLSHGQKQWLEIGMLLLQAPQLLLLDEPVAGMTVRERELTARLLKAISSQRSLIVIEHDMDFVERIASKVTVLHQGSVLSEGSAAQVKNDPRVIDVYLGH
ncbi:MAG: urea ABC transporter ATP-binding protein UrtD [Pseudomonadota bacterium]